MSHKTESTSTDQLEGSEDMTGGSGNEVCRKRTPLISGRLGTQSSDSNHEKVNFGQKI